jgi:hypothetical protein
MPKNQSKLVGIQCNSCKDQLYSLDPSQVTWCDCRKVGLTGGQKFTRVMGTGEFKYIKIKHEQSNSN